MHDVLYLICRMSLLVLVALFSWLMSSCDATNIADECPVSCSCDLTHSGSNLKVDCGRSIPGRDGGKLSLQLDSMLSSYEIVERLTTLTITNTPLTRVPASLCQLLNLTSLNLDRNSLKKLPYNCITNLTKLVTFSATDNSIVGLQDGLFDGLQSLRSIDLSHNQISFIGLHVFSNVSDLERLRLLNLDYNKLTSLEPWWYYRCIHGSETFPVHITLGWNMISHFTNKQKFRFRCGMTKPFGMLDLSKNRITHITDAFNGWNIMGPIISLCIQNIDRSARMKFIFAGYEYACDCVDFWIYKALSSWSRSRILNNVWCSRDKFISPTGQRILAKTIPLNEFVCDEPNRCPPDCRCTYRPQNATLHVNCFSANLSSLPLDLPPLPKRYAKYKLDFSNNKKLQRLERRPYLTNTSILDVSNCGLTEIDMELWKSISHMKWVNVRGNSLQTFPERIDTFNMSGKLLVGGNPWMCSCDNSWMIGWVKSMSHHLADTGDMICRSPSRMHGRNIIKSTDEDFCVDPVKRALTISMSTVASAFILLISAGLLIYKLRIKFYKRWKFHPFDRDECVGEEMDYDVYLCCSSEDNNLHGNRIMDLIELKAYRVFYHLRDFLGGVPIMENMIHGVVRSKRTVCLVSNNFLQRSVIRVPNIYVNKFST